MKLLGKIMLLALICMHYPLSAQVQTESQQIIYPVTDTDSIFVINPGESFNQKISFVKQDIPTRRLLRIVGGTKMPGHFTPRGETLFRAFEFYINDHLDSLNVSQDKYSLYFKGDNEPYEHHAYYRLSKDVLSTGKISVEINAKRNNLKVEPNGDFGVELHVYYTKKGRHHDDVYDKADDIFFMPINDGNGDFETFKKEFTPKHEVAAILVRVGGIHFNGECWLEAPHISMGGKALPEIPFTRFDDKDNAHNYWVGINMVSRNWPMWRLEFKDKTIFRGNIFDRASDIADFYITLPEDVEGEGMLKLFLEKEPYKAAFPYNLHSVQLIEEPSRAFEIVSVPRYITVGDTTGILIETNQPNLTLTVSGGTALGLPEKNFTFKETGLHVIPVIAVSEAVDIPVSLSYNGETRNGQVKQTIIKGHDNIYLSSGDEIHIDNVYEPYNHFFKWYIRERVGNWYQFRPSYQWSGVRITDEKFVKHYTHLLNQLHIPYAWQVEGRTLAATRINPTLNALQSPMFRGKQAHENDGGYYYWQHFHYEGLHSDMAARTRPYGGIFAKHRPIYTDHGTFIHYDPYAVKDMSDGARRFVENLAYSRGESTRHTGPSTSFRYLYQAGYEWLGAEQMYGPEELIMSSLRGTSRAYGKDNFGSLHAVQWGSFPFTDPKHALRFHMSLAVSYMHGAKHINTEEGLWTDEYANDYFTEAGKRHMYAQHQIFDYIETHTRRGKLNPKIAVFHGRNDAWKSFGRQTPWSQKGDKWTFNEAMQSFDLLKVFYPEHIIDGCGPEGWFTSTPYGPIDLLPIEANQDILDSYKVLIFLGWNTYNTKDFERIAKFVEKGGTLLLTAAHLNSELQPNITPQFPKDDSIIKKLLGKDYKNLKEKTEINHGKGKVIYFPEQFYPINNKIKDEYISDMKRITSDVISSESMKAWINASPYISFTPWDEGNRRTLLLLNIDWDSEQFSRPANLVVNNKHFEVDIDRYTIATIHSENDLAVMPRSNTSDVLNIASNTNEWIVTVQTTDKDIVKIYNGITGKESSEAITGAGIHKITITK